MPAPACHDHGVAGWGTDLPDWERLLAAERHLQHLVPGAVLSATTPTTWGAAMLVPEERVVLPPSLLDRDPGRPAG